VTKAEYKRFIRKWLQYVLLTVLVGLMILNLFNIGVMSARTFGFEKTIIGAACVSLFLVTGLFALLSIMDEKI
jgi:hypothetical protein